MSNQRTNCHVRISPGRALRRGLTVLAALAAPLSQSITAEAQTRAVSISFQPASFPLQSGYKGDYGHVFGNRGNGYSYGWNVSHTARTFGYSAIPGWEGTFGAAWSLIRMLPGPTTRWEIAVTNGTYEISIVAAGYRCQGQLQQIAAEGVLVVNSVAGWDYDTYVGGTQQVLVQDGRLTITNGPTAAENCIDLIHIRPR
jgi:pectate lyase